MRLSNLPRLPDWLDWPTVLAILLIGIWLLGSTFELGQGIAEGKLPLYIGGLVLFLAIAFLVNALNNYVFTQSLH